MGRVVFGKLLVAVSIVFLSTSVRAEPIKLNYDCSFEIPMTFVYPPNLYDSSSDGTFRIRTSIVTHTIRDRTVYVVRTSKSWPVLVHTQSVHEDKRPLLKRNNTYTLGELKLIGPLRKTIAAKHYISSSELYMGGGCASCGRAIRGTCERVRK